MGLETAAITFAAIAGGATLGKMGAEVAGAHAKESALDLESKQMALETQQKTISNYDVAQKLLDSQTAHMTTTGAAFSSPSFNAIERNTLNIASKKQRNIDTEGSIAEENIEQEKHNTRLSLYGQLFGDVSNLAMSAYSINSEMPTKA